MDRFHEVNKMYDGIIDEIHHFMYATDIATNKCFTFINSMKQDDKMSLIDAMEK